jgi:hypothetical protein
MRKFLYSAGLIYLFFYMFPFPFMTAFGKILDPIVYFVGNKILNIKIPVVYHIFALDTTFEYVKIFTLFIASLVIATILKIAFSKRIKFELIYDTAVLYARYFVGLFMINYGITKLCSVQFSMPGYIKLESTFGESSPMGLLWAYMGYSKAYTVFIGILEAFFGALLLFKRTKTLGSLLAFGMLVNIVITDLCYDVPAKIFSIHLLILSVLIGAGEIKTVYSFFILHSHSQLPPIQGSESKYRLARGISKGLLISGCIIFSSYHYLEHAFTNGVYAKQNKIDGLYKTELFVIENDTLAPIATDSIRWKSLIISRGISRVTKMTDSTEIFNIVTDSLSSTITFSLENHTEQNYKLNYDDDKGKFKLKGIWKGKKVNAIFTKKTYKDYPLIKRGFHWVNESVLMN